MLRANNLTQLEGPPKVGRFGEFGESGNSDINLVKVVDETIRANKLTYQRGPKCW